MDDKIHRAQKDKQAKIWQFYQSDAKGIVDGLLSWKEWLETRT